MTQRILSTAEQNTLTLRSSERGADMEHLTVENK